MKCVDLMKTANATAALLNYDSCVDSPTVVKEHLLQPFGGNVTVTEATVAEATVPPPICSLEFRLDLPSTGHEADGVTNRDFMIIQRGDGEHDNDYCWSSSYEHTDWCMIEKKSKPDNTHPDTFIVEDLAGMTANITIIHIFPSGDSTDDYYDSWTSKGTKTSVFGITNTVTGESLRSEGGWPHSVDDHQSYVEKIPTFINGIGGYEGKFSVVLSCTDSCDCTTGDYIVF
jgi:hypothetical protein